MMKTVVISGNEYPATAALVQSALDAEKNVMVAVSDSNTEIQTPGNEATSYVWHKTSPVSARSLLLEAENKFESIDCGFIVFDSEVFFSKFNVFTLENISRGNDEMLVSMQYLTYEFIKRFELAKKGMLCFVLNPVMSIAEITRNVRSAQNAAPLTALTAAAEAAFRAFAENIAAVSVGKAYKTLLVERGIEDREIFSKWLIAYADQYYTVKKKISAKDSIKWLRSGAKSPASRSFFSR
ncbi:MAG TPA: hypothetical protein VFC68_05935 [Treponemataceae bacterium]|nr:hypothetical protein [Treponemataceae bacterium]